MQKRDSYRNEKRHKPNKHLDSAKSRKVRSQSIGFVQKNANLIFLLAIMLFIGLSVLYIRPAFIGFVILSGEESIVYNGSLNTTSILGGTVFNATAYASADWFYLANVSREIVIFHELPTILFTTPTDANNTQVIRNSTYINFTVNVTVMHTFIVNWNGTNVTVYEPSLLLHMHFNNDSNLGENASRFVDVSNYSNIGTCDLANARCPAINKTDPKFGAAALTFDGLNDYLNISLNNTNYSITGNNSYTIEFWIKETVNNSNVHIFENINPSGSSAPSFEGNTTEYRYYVNRNTFISSGALAIGEWHHIAAVYNETGKQQLLYIDGSLKGTNTIDANDSISSLIFGANATANARFWNSSLDELRIYNRSLSAAEIKASYNTEFGRYFFNITDLSEGIYTYYGFVNDTFGLGNNTATNIIKSNSLAPIYTNNVTNATTMRYNTTVMFNITWNDSNAGYYTFSFDNSSGIFVNDTPQVFISGTPIVINKTINATRGNTVRWLWYANDSISNLNQTIISSFIVANTQPSQVILVSPANFNITTNRTQLLTWNASIDVDNDALTYNILIRCYNACSDDNRDVNVSSTSYSPPDLRYLGDDGFYYNWSVAAFDGTEFGARSTEFNLTVNSLVSINLINSVVNFTALALNQAENTTDNNPLPFILENDGNVFLNISLYTSNSLWNSTPSPTQNYQFMIANYTELLSFNYTTSTTTTFTNIPTSSTKALIDLNYNDSRDTAEIEINITVPLDEPPGSKQATMVIEGIRSK